MAVVWCAVNIMLKKIHSYETSAYLWYVHIWQEIQGESESARTEIKRKTAELELANVEKERINGRLKAAEGLCG